MNLETLPTIILPAIVLLGAGALVFRRFGRDYEHLASLSRLSMLLGLLILVLHAVSSYVYLDSRLSTVDTSSPLFGLSLVLIIGGLVLLLTSMGRLGGKKTMGQDTNGLYCANMYRHSRNPQVLFYGLVVVGYALLWPSWQGVIWVLLYAGLAHMMVRVEEVHLKRKYGKEYVEYCAYTPRYIDMPGSKKK
ncbi:MAG: methyltransferase family protein [Chloroflexota bacterium]